MLDMVSSSTVLASGIAANGSASNYVAVTSGTIPVSLEVTGSGAPSFTTNFVLTSADYSIVAFPTYLQGRPVVQAIALPENQTAPAAGGGAQLRLYDLAPDAGHLDVYVQPTGQSMGASPLAANFSGTVNYYYPIAAGTYDVWVTGAGAPADLRLKMSAVTITDTEVATLAFTGTPGGVLVSGLVVAQPMGGNAVPVSAQLNSNARIRLAVSFTDNKSIASGTVATATANQTSVVGATPVQSPAAESSYVLAPAGSLLPIVLGGATCDTSKSATTTVANGSDSTLLVVGSSVSPVCYILNDDNTLPAIGNANLRLVNGIVSGVNSGGNLALVYNSQQILSNVAFGTATEASVPSGISSNLLVISAANGLYAPTSAVTLQQQGVYSVFMLGDGTQASDFVLVRDH